MHSLSQSIIDNVDAGQTSYIETYLNGKKHKRVENELGLDVKYWLDNLFKRDEINVEEFEDFLFSELFWGKRKSVRIYKLDNIKDYKYPTDWEEVLQEKYRVDSIDFNNILDTLPNEKQPIKIAAVHSVENEKGELRKIQLLFSLYIQIEGERNTPIDSCTYIPVEVDFEKKLMILKAWQRQKIYFETNKIDALFEQIMSILQYQFKVKVNKYGREHKKILYYMSKELIDKAYLKVPSFNEITTITPSIHEFINLVINKLPLKNVDIDENENKILNEGVMAFEDEVRNVVESLAINDYFFDKGFDEIWNMGLNAIVARIKFNDRESVLTSLTGENTSTPIFVTKTFMTLRRRMDESEKVESLWIAMDRKRGNLNLKYDASNQDYLELLIRYGIRFCEADMNSALNIYRKYEQEYNNQITEKDKIAIGQ